MSIHSSSDGDQSPESPRTVSRGVNLQLGFLGIDSLYAVIEYPHADTFNHWWSQVGDLHSPKLYDGIVWGDFVLRTGAHGYKLSVWDGDARLYLTDRVADNLQGTRCEGQGMGALLQLGPKWLRQYGDDGVGPTKRLIADVLGQMAYFGIREPEAYPIRLNRLDITVDVIGLDATGLSITEWHEQWVGRAKPRALYFSPKSGQVQGLQVGSAEGAVALRVYDKVFESQQKGLGTFWRSVWGLSDDTLPVTRFEWPIHCYRGKFARVRYLQDLTFQSFMGLLNYASLKWGRLCLPNENDDNQTRWPLAPLWADLRWLIDDWSLHYDEIIPRRYDYKTDVTDAYLNAISGWFAGLQARVGLVKNLGEPASLEQSLDYLEKQGYDKSDIAVKAREKWERWTRLQGGDR